MIRLASLLLLLLTSSAWGASAPYESALGMLHDGKIDEAYELLSSLPSADARYPDALVELQKIHYLRQDWQRFFGHAAFYHARVPTFRARLYSLEAMALAKHCQWTAARRVIESAWKQTRNREDREELASTAAHLGLPKEFPATPAAREDSSRPFLSFGSELYWKIDPSQLKHVASPRSLRMVVESRCAR